MILIMNEKNIKLLTRKEFKEEIFKRDNNKCVVPDCSKKAIDAHHIIERKLFSDGGYYLNNGASLCSEHHLEAEEGIITVGELFEYTKIDKSNLPIPTGWEIIDYMDCINSNSIDKWGLIKEEIENVENWWEKYKRKN